MALMGLLAAACFALLAFAILHDAVLALALVAGAAIVLGAFSLLFTWADGIVGRLPVPGTFPGKTAIKLALRNIGRHQHGIIITQVALFVSIFAVGAILILGQGLQSQYAQGGHDVNAIVWTSNLNATEQQLQQSNAVSRNDVYRETSFAPQSLNGTNITAAIANHQYDQNGLLPLDGILGFDLAHSQIPSAPDYTLVAGRMLTAGDAGSHNVVIIATTRDAPLSLKLGDQFNVQYLSKSTFKSGGTAGSAPGITLTIVGFYQNNTGVPSLESTLLADYATVDAVGGANALYELGLHINPQRADGVLTQLQAAMPGQVFVHSYVDAYAQTENYLSSLIIVLEAIVLPAFLAAIINIANAVGLAILDRRREMGILKAVGRTSRGVLADVMLEQGIAALMASLCAMLCAGGLALFLSVLSGKGGTATPVVFSLPTAGAIIGASTLLGVIITALVAWQASRRRPLEALRYE